MIELTVLISVVSVSASLYFGLRTARRSQRQDSQAEAANMTTVVIKLENIGNGINEIKGELRSVKEDAKELRERVVITEQSAKQAHKRLDDMIRQ